jgi:pyruvate formate lyase activating enzyme
VDVGITGPALSLKLRENIRYVFGVFDKNILIIGQLFKLAPCDIMNIKQLSEGIPMNNKRDLSVLLLRIEKSSIHDGEGLRTVVFLKGCNLRCLWCSTPESQHTEIEIGFDTTRCRDCGVCIEKCRNRALSRRYDGRIILDKNYCSQCLLCQDICPYQALYYYGCKVSVADVFDEILKDEVFYFHSGGGVTISGGEPLLHSDFVVELFKHCKNHGINTALETSFCLPWNQAAKPLPYLDTLFVDLKHSDSHFHEQITGVKNDAVLANIILADNNPELFEIVMRLPLIPALNDDEQNLRKTAALAASLTKLKYLEILPYHRLGSGVYTKLGREYVLRDLPTPSPAYVMEKCAFIRSCQPDLMLKY